MFARLLASLTLFAVAAACSAQVPPPAKIDLQEGRDYVVINPAVPPSAPAGTIEVIEVFGYSCIHCANLQPIVDQWKAQLPEDVHFSYMPAIFGGAWEIYGRAYYAAETMGILGKAHSAVFNALHVERRPVRSVEDVADLFVEHGVTREDFMASMNSFAVNAKVARAQQTVQRYGVEGTPAMIVAGKYRVMTPREGGFEALLQIVDALVARERAALAAN